MEKFRDFLQDEGLPGNDRKETFEIPMNLTYDFGHQLKVLRPKKKKANGSEYSFSRDGAMPLLGDVPDALRKNKIEVDWYPKIQAIVSQAGRSGKPLTPNECVFSEAQIAFLNFDQLYFDLERYKARENLYSLIITQQAIRRLLVRDDWYVLFVPDTLMLLSGYSNVRIWNQIALELLKKYCKRFYLYSVDAFIRPRLEYQALERGNANLPEERERYQIMVDASEKDLIEDIKSLKKQIEAAAKQTQHFKQKRIEAFLLSNHLYSPLIYAEKGCPITIAPVALNESEKNFVGDLMTWLMTYEAKLLESKTSIFLLRNKSRGKGIGFFEAGNFYPDFILWAVTGDQQVVVFIEPHGIAHEGPNHPKVQFHKTVKEIEQRLAGKENIRLESFIVTPTHYQLVEAMGCAREEWEQQHVLFMERPNYVDVLMNVVIN